MDHVSMFLEKMKVVAEQTRTATVKAADRAGRKAGEMAQATRINLQIFDRNTECEVLYKEIGRLIYDIHQGVQIEEQAIETRLTQLDALHNELEHLRGQLAALKTICPHCGRQCSREDAYCAGCGSRI